MLESRRLLAVDAQIALGRPIFDGGIANFPVEIDFSASAGEKLVFFSLDAANSSASLIGPESGFSAFSFEPSTPLLDDWRQIGFFNDPDFNSTVEFEDSLVASLPTGVYTLGTLNVNFGAAGLSFGDIFTVSLEGIDTVIAVKEQGVARFEPVSFNPGSRTVVPVSLTGPETVAEGSVYALTIDTLVETGIDLIIDWGDGQQETLNVEDVPANRQVTHVFADGIDSATILVDVEDQHGTQASAGNLDVSILNVAPSVTLSGETSVNEGQSYSLTVGAVSDPGTDTVTHYTIDWGDGQQQTIAAGDLPLDRTVTHTYVDGVAAALIVVGLQDEDGLHADAGHLAITVNDVSPTVALSGASEVDEGSNYTLTIGAVTDPGQDTLLQYIIHWGDGQQQIVDVVDFPANGQFNHTYADGTASLLIKVDLVDEDGPHASSGALAVRVENVSPTVLLTGANTIDEGFPYTLTIGEVSDPGQDTVTSYIIHWGDGQQNTVTAADLAASNRNVTHTYSDEFPPPTIVVHVVDEDGTHVAGSKTVTVNNVEPIVALSGATNTDEGATYTLTLGPVNDPGNDTVTGYVVRWGDGEQDEFTAAELEAANRQVTHTFADGPASALIILDVVDEDGLHVGVSSLPLAIKDISPSIALSGAANVAEGSTYTLTLGDVTDPGTDTVSEYRIHWPDGQEQVVESVNLPANRQISHTFTDGAITGLIVVDLVDEDATHLAAGLLAITVNNVAPTISITGAANVAEGSPYTVTLGAVTDPGLDAVTQYVIRWGDGQQTVYNAAELPANRQITHTFADGPNTLSIAVDLIDEDGTHAAAGARTVIVNNVPPSIVLMGATTVPEGSIYTLTLGAVSDPGTDTVTQYIIRWGDGRQDIINAANLPATRQVTHTYVDNLVPTISVDLVDEDGTSTTAGSLPITVTNVAPSVTTITNTSAACGGIVEGHPISVSLTFTDPGADGLPGGSSENFTASIDWGDGTQQPPSQITLTKTPGGPGVPTQGTVSANHTYSNGGIYRITIKVSDDDGQFVTASTTAMLTGAGVTNNVLYVVGTNSSDHVTINKQGNGQFKVHADFFESGNFKTFSTTGVHFINAVLCGADDHLNMAGNITTMAILDGGPGEDHINAHNNELVVDDGDLPTGNVDLGTVDFRSLPNLNLATADQSFSFKGMHTGTLTLEALFASGQGSSQLVLLDKNLKVLASSTPVAGGHRLDSRAIAGEELYVYVLGTNPDVDVSIVNMITQNSPLTVHGTSGDDQFEFIAGDVLQLRVNGVDYNYDPARVTSVTFLGNGGADEIALTASSVDDVVSLLQQTAELLGDNYSAFVKGIDSIVVRDSDHRPLLQNPVIASDVNGDGIVTPLDALSVINWLNDYSAQSVVDLLTSVPPGTVTAKYDVNGDGVLSAMDVLLVINTINRGESSSTGVAESAGAEGEAFDSGPTDSIIAAGILVPALLYNGSSPQVSLGADSASLDELVPTVRAASTRPVNAAFGMDEAIELSNSTSHDDADEPSIRAAVFASLGNDDDDSFWSGDMNI